MSIENQLRQLQKALDERQVATALHYVTEAAPGLSEEPRVLLPVIDALDRQRQDELLAPLVAKLQELDILSQEMSVFELRLKFRAGRYGEALRVIERIMAADDNPEALRTGGRIGNLTHDDAVALRYWERLARASASEAEAPLQAARIHLRRQQYSHALAFAQLAAERRAEALEPVQIGVTAALELGWPKECDTLLATLFKLDRAKALKPLARLSEELDAEDAARLLSLLRGQLPSDPAVNEVIDKVLATWHVAALEQELASRELEAAAFYRAARTVQPGDSNVERALDRLCSPSLVAMREAFGSRDFGSAIEHAEMATKINPTCFEAWRTLGRAQFTLGNMMQAREAFRRCTELDPKHGASWLAYGLVLNQSGMRSAALVAYQTARGLADADVRREADASIAALHPQLVRDAHQAAADGEIQKSWEALEGALAIRKEDPDLSQLRRTVLRQQLGQVREAWNAGAENTEALCRSYLEKAPGDLYASTVLGRTLMKARAYGAALPVWEGLSRQTPHDAHAFLQIARCCRALKLKDRGLAAAENALRLAPDLQEAADLAGAFRTQAQVSEVSAKRSTTAA